MVEMCNWDFHGITSTVHCHWPTRTPCLDHPAANTQILRVVLQAEKRCAASLCCCHIDPETGISLGKANWRIRIEVDRVQANDRWFAEKNPSEPTQYARTCFFASPTANDSPRTVAKWPNSHSVRDQRRQKKRFALLLTYCNWPMHCQISFNDCCNSESLRVECLSIQNVPAWDAIHLPNVQSWAGCHWLLHVKKSLDSITYLHMVDRQTKEHLSGHRYENIGCLLPHTNVPGYRLCFVILEIGVWVGSGWRDRDLQKRTIIMKYILFVDL